MLNSDLYTHDNYLNDSIEAVFNKKIIEYDIKSANTSLMKEYSLLPENVIHELEKLPKKDRVVRIGKLMKADKKFKDDLMSAFEHIRKRFFDENDIEDEDVLTIKKDAIFLFKKVKNTKIGECHFIEKNVYTSYLYLNKLEIYFKSNLLLETSEIDVKGINDEILKYHEEHMIKFLKHIFLLSERNSKEKVLKYIKSFSSSYKKYELDLNYYREFNSSSLIVNRDTNEGYKSELKYPYEKETADLSYNFCNIIAPLARVIIEQ